MYLKRAGQGHKGETYNDVIIMADTETSKETPGIQCKNYVVAWSISIRAFNSNIFAFYFFRPRFCFRIVMNCFIEVFCLYNNNSMRVN